MTSTNNNRTTAVVSSIGKLADTLGLRFIYWSWMPRCTQFGYIDIAVEKLEDRSLKRSISDP